MDESRNRAAPYYVDEGFRAYLFKRYDHHCTCLFVAQPRLHVSDIAKHSKYYITMPACANLLPALTLTGGTR